MREFERAPDPVDLASDREEIDRDNALRRVIERANIKAPADFDGETCVDCGLDIPAGRLALGKWTCIYCQELRDKPRN